MLLWFFAYLTESAGLMKPILTHNLPFLFVIGLSFSAAASPDPRPVDVVHFWDDAGVIMPLEQASVVSVAASPGFPATWEIKGARSQFRIKRAPALLFLVRLPEGADPAKIQLFHLTGNGARKPYPPHDDWRTVTLSVTKAGDSFGLAPVGELVEGEYAFLRAGSAEAYCFGIDPPK
jgi:hypothetical protein